MSNPFEFSTKTPQQRAASTTPWVILAGLFCVIGVIAIASYALIPGKPTTEQAKNTKKEVPVFHPIKKAVDVEQETVFVPLPPVVTPDPAQTEKKDEVKKKSAKDCIEKGKEHIRDGQPALARIEFVDGWNLCTKDEDELKYRIYRWLGMMTSRSKGYSFATSRQNKDATELQRRLSGPDQIRIGNEVIREHDEIIRPKKK